MQLGETNHELRRIPIVIWSDDGSSLASGADVSPPAHSFQVSQNGAAFTDAGGTFAAVSGGSVGKYYYEASSAEANVRGFLAFKFERPGFQTQIVFTIVGDIWSTGETTATALRWPIIIYDDTEPPALVEGATASGSELRTGLNGNTLTTAAGTLVEVGSGLYYYQGVSADASSTGALWIEFNKSGFQVEITTVSVADPGASSGDSSPPVVDLISPAAGTVPGDVGGFSSDFRIATNTPIVVDITDAELQYICVVVRFEDGNEEVVYRRGQFRGRYFPASVATGISFGSRLTIRRSGGWPAGIDPNTISQIILAVDVLDNSGNIDA